MHCFRNILIAVDKSNPSSLNNLVEFIFVSLSMDTEVISPSIDFDKRVGDYQGEYAGNRIYNKNANFAVLLYKVSVNLLKIDNKNANLANMLYNDVDERHS